MGGLALLFAALAYRTEAKAQKKEAEHQKQQREQEREARELVENAGHAMVDGLHKETRVKEHEVDTVKRDHFS